MRTRDDYGRSVECVPGVDLGRVWRRIEAEIWLDRHPAHFASRGKADALWLTTRHRFFRWNLRLLRGNTMLSKGLQRGGFRRPGVR
jgi:hypothetical protein